MDEEYPVFGSLAEALAFKAAERRRRAQLPFAEKIRIVEEMLDEQDEIRRRRKAVQRSTDGGDA